MKKKPNILVVDDDNCTLEVLYMILQNGGYEVDVARDHNMEFLNTKKYPDIILLDNNLGKRNGSDICKELKANDETRHIPVIMISAMDDIKKIAEDSCADDFIAKPFGIQLLMEKINKCLDKN